VKQHGESSEFVGLGPQGAMACIGSHVFLFGPSRTEGKLKQNQLEKQVWLTPPTLLAPYLYILTTLMQYPMVYRDAVNYGRTVRLVVSNFTRTFKVALPPPRIDSSGSTSQYALCIPVLAARPSVPGRLEMK